jgi:putative chitinase
MITIEQLTQLFPETENLEQWHQALTQLLPDYGIDTCERQAAFIAQCAHESNNFQTIRENLNYRAASLQRVFPKYFSTQELADEYANRQEKIANRVYANRMGNGDEASGDGYRYCGRGAIQITGKDNYQLFADSIQCSLQDVVVYMSTFEGAIQSACWFWETNNLNKFVDANDFDGLCDTVNLGHKTEKVGDAIGYQDRLAKYTQIKAILCGV